MSEPDIRTRYIAPALAQAAWEGHKQICEGFTLSKGRVIVRGELHSRVRIKLADYVLFRKPNLPIAVV